MLRNKHNLCYVVQAPHHYQDFQKKKNSHFVLYMKSYVFDVFNKLLMSRRLPKGAKCHLR